MKGSLVAEMLNILGFHSVVDHNNNNDEEEQNMLFERFYQEYIFEESTNDIENFSDEIEFDVENLTASQLRIILKYESELEQCNHFACIFPNSEYAR